MTKDTYFEMCEMLNQEPIEEEIPVEVSDFPELVQQCFVIYSMLSDIWDSMGGSYLGKDYSTVFKLLELHEITEHQETVLCLEFLRHMDQVRQKLVAEKIKANSPQH